MSNENHFDVHTSDNIKSYAINPYEKKPLPCKPEGQVALITSLPGAGSLDQRAKGFKEEIAAQYPGLKLVADKIADGMPSSGLNIMTDLITANPDLRGEASSIGVSGVFVCSRSADNLRGFRFMLNASDQDV